MTKIYNFCAGPSALPAVVVEESKKALYSFYKDGVGICEVSHRWPIFENLLFDTCELVKEHLKTPDDYTVLFLPGGASLQFAAIALNFLQQSQISDYIISGIWSNKAYHEAQKLGKTNICASGEASKFTILPKIFNFSPESAYVHFTSNNTIYGTEWQQEPPVAKTANLICDASSNLFSRPLAVNKYALIYASAQKNFGPSGLCLVIIKKSFLETAKDSTPSMLNYKVHERSGSLFNTPNNFAVFVVNRTLKWLKNEGGLLEMKNRNQQKAKLLYDFIDNSKLFTARVKNTGDRSQMNVVFSTQDPIKDLTCVDFANKAGIIGIKGHKSIGGLRVSLYNAISIQAVNTLITMLHTFEKKYS